MEGEPPLRGSRDEDAAGQHPFPEIDELIDGLIEECGRDPDLAGRVLRRLLAEFDLLDLLGSLDEGSPDVTEAFSETLDQIHREESATGRDSPLDQE